MHIDILRKKNRIIDVLYDGEHYTFTDRFLGTFAVAHRVGTTHHFLLEYGNSNHYYESDAVADAEIAKKYINNAETQFRKDNVCGFDTVRCDCNNKYFLTINLNVRDGYKQS